MNQDSGSRLTFFSTTDTTSEIKTAKMSIQKKESQDQSSNQLIMQMDENFKETKITIILALLFLNWMERNSVYFYEKRALW